MATLDTRIWFYPGTAECVANLGYPTVPPTASTAPPPSPDNVMGGFAEGTYLGSYDGTEPGGVNLFIGPDAAAFSVGITDTMPCYYPQAFSSTIKSSWYLMRQVDFKDWNGIAGIFKRKASFTMEVDVEVTSCPISGGFREEAPNSAQGAVGNTNTGFSTPYTDAGPQGSGVMLKAIVTDEVSHVEKILATHIFQAPDGVAWSGGFITFPRQIVALELPDITPYEMGTMVLRLITEQYSGTYVPVGQYYLHDPLVTIIRRVGLTANPESLRSSGKQSAALTSR